MRRGTPRAAEYLCFEAAVPELAARSPAAASPCAVARCRRRWLAAETEAVTAAVAWVALVGAEATEAVAEVTEATEVAVPAWAMAVVVTSLSWLHGPRC